MYSYEWDEITGGYILNSTQLKFSKEPRPVYYHELDALGLNRYWKYEKNDSAPLMWAETNNYWYRGQKIAIAHGGSLFNAPKIEVLVEHPEGIGNQLSPVDIVKMVEKNSEIMEILTNKSIKWIVKTYGDNLHKTDIFYVAFSGGKDSVVVLDLVQKALPFREFKVVFGNTRMEFPDTYDLVNNIKQEMQLKEIDFIEAISERPSLDSWRCFGPPSQTIRWCCGVHKTSPQVIALRKSLMESLGRPNFRGVAFIGIRGDESSSRSEYDDFSYGKKHNGQSNAYPIFDWNSAEVYLYIYQNKLLLNEAYKRGTSRVGCLVCPEAANKNEFFKMQAYPVQTQQYLDIIRECNFDTTASQKDIDDYLNYGGWKARRSGEVFHESIEKYSDEIIDNHLSIKVSNAASDWKTWIQTIGEFVPSDCEGGKHSIDYKGMLKYFEIRGTDKEYTVLILASDIYSAATFFKLFKQVFRKAAYCIACGECEANCDKGCINSGNGKISIIGCKHCAGCHNIENGCLLYFSRRKAKETKMDNKSINHYGNLAPQPEWIESFIKYDGDYAKGVSLGTNKIKSFGAFLRDAELLVDKKFSILAKTVKRVGFDSGDMGWALILANLAYSAEVNWFIKTLTRNNGMMRDEFEARIFEYSGYNSTSQAPKHISQAFIILAKGPLGSVGLGKIEDISGKKFFSNGVWQSPNPLVILYSLYKFAEACDGYYQFTLSRILDFTIESEGISPAQIFGLDENKLASILRGLSTSYAEYINYSETLGLKTINLRKSKTAVDVLNLF